MKPRSVASLAARVFVGAMLVYAGAAKASAPAEEFAFVLQAYDVVPASLTLPASGLLPWLELLVGWALILGVQTRAALLAAGALIGVFLAALLSVVARGISIPNCGCFGGAVHFTPLQALALDSATATLCWFARRDAPGPLSLDSWSRRGL